MNRYFVQQCEMAGKGNKMYARPQMALFLMVMVTTLLCPHRASGEATKNESPNSAREALAALDASTDRRDRLRHVYTLEANMVCRAMLGANGELITRGPHNPGAPEASRSILGVIPEDQGYRVIWLAYDCAALGLSFGDTYARIDGDGKFTLAVRQELRRLLPLSPTHWPALPDNTGLLFPDRETIIARTSESVSPKEANPPNGVLGCCLLDWDGYLITPTDALERPENLLWVVRTADGIQFVHSGPLRTGIYATITGDRRVHYGPGAPDSLRIKESPDWWPYVKDGQIVSIPKGRLGRPGPEYLFAVWNGDTLVGLNGNPPIE